ncbi:putative mucin/carbohydrate-binding domain-containing protein, partial [Bacillus mycoides]
FLNISHTDWFDVPFSQERQKFFPDKYYENKEEYFAECFTYYYFSESSKQELKDKAPLTYSYIDLLIKNVQGDSNSTEPINELLDGNQFSWSLKGYSDREFAKVDYNKKAEEMKIKLEAGIPHSYFNSTYASIKVQNSSGIVVYNKEIVGNRQQNSEIQTVPVKVGDYIKFTHIEGEAVKEKTRATLTNLENSKQEYIGKKRTYQVTSTGLSKID